MANARVLIVDDDEGACDALAAQLARDGHRCELVPSPARALDAVDHEPFDLVVCEPHVGGLRDLTLLGEIKQRHPTLPVIVLTSRGVIEEAVSALKAGAAQYITKPWDAGHLRRAVLDAIDEGAHARAEVGRHALALRASQDQLVGDGAAMTILRESIELVARAEAPVLILGDTGTGKELVARAIHSRGARRAHPFLAVNTCAIPEALLEGEVFGHTRGAFTGAVHPRKGLLSQADRGTLLLDEIGDMPVAMQAKLLRVLEAGDVRPLGSDRAHHVDVRMIAATHRDLRSLVAGGRFREDLFFRLHVLPVVVPRLRDRTEDIPALVAHFLAASLRRTPSSPVREVGDDAMRVLRAATWPGNVRELASTVERLVVLGRHEVVTAADAAFLEITNARGAPPWPDAGAQPWTMKRMTETYARWVIDKSGGNKQRAAETLGVDLSTLYRWQRARQH